MKKLIKFYLKNNNPDNKNNILSNIYKYFYKYFLRYNNIIVNNEYRLEEFSA
jgi:hypothetical protein